MEGGGKIEVTRKLDVRVEARLYTRQNPRGVWPGPPGPHGVKRTHAPRRAASEARASINSTPETVEIGVL